MTDVRRKKVPPRIELIELRRQKFPNQRKEFAAKIGIVPAHMLSIEQGRRPPSPELAVRWIEALGPPARLEMFGPLEELDRAIATIKHLKRVEPAFYDKAA